MKQNIGNAFREKQNDQSMQKWFSRKFSSDFESNNQLYTMSKKEAQIRHILRCLYLQRN